MWTFEAIQDDGNDGEEGDGSDGKEDDVPECPLSRQGEVEN